VKEKQVLFFGRTDAGIYAQALFGSAGCFEKTAGADPFSDWETGEELRKYIQTITSDDRKRHLYVLVNALGAGEYFGSNINADYFPWESLAHKGTDYGYQTFLNAHAFQHHANKDPARAFGNPVLSVLNHRMRRVELVIKLDREAAERQGAGSILARIESGDFPDVSMGCRVPWDECSVRECLHRSKTRDDYCKHMRPPEELRGIYGPNRILPDGQKIFVKNIFPRFFDISFVFIGADKTAKVMAKLAQKGAQLCLGNVCAVPTVVESSLFDSRGVPLSSDGLSKAASCSGASGLRGPCGRLCSSCAEQVTCHTEKLASAFGVKEARQKLSEIVKQVPSSSFGMKTLPAMEKQEPDISPKDLDFLAQKRLQDVLGTISRTGMVLKPHEYQHVVLRRMGEDDLLNQLTRERKVFRQVPDFDFGGMGSRDSDEPLDAIFVALKKYIKERTALGTPFQLRVMIAGRGAKNVLPTRAPIEHPLLDKVSAAYNGYRRSFLKKISQVVDAVESDPKLREAVLGEGLSTMFLKKANAEILTPDSMRYLLGAHLQDRSLLCSDAVAGAAVFEHADLFRETTHAA
jgi:hypothetical protein